MFDIAIRNGTVVDGSGSPGFRADVVVSGGRIETVGDSTNVQARRIIDAQGLVVCPGFVDMHTHSDILLLANPRQESKIMQGVTTEVLGQDGLSYAPVNKDTLQILRKNLKGLNGDCEELAWDWTSVGEYLALFDGKVAVNVCYLIPHGAIRMLVLGTETRTATDAELAQMRALVAEAMSEGGVGFSTGLTYPPCAYSDMRELVACCRGITPLGGYFAPHLRSYGAHFVEAINEALQVGRESGAPVHFTHFHCSFEPNEGRANEMLAILDSARSQGMDVTLDSYPYTAASTFLGGFFPSWVHAGGPTKFMERIASAAEREKIRQEMEEEGCDGFSHVPIDWPNIVIGGVASEKNQWAVGGSIAKLAAQKGKAPFDLACELLLDEKLEVSILAFIGFEKNVQTIMQHPFQMAGTDGLLTGARPHPRAWGTFARYLQHYTRELKILTLPQCIRKMTSLPAARLGLPQRGLVRKGMAADLVVFDAEHIEDTATYENPRSHPRGIAYVLVNGQIAVENGKHTGALAGRILN